MRASALESRPLREWVLFGMAGMLSLLAHCAGAMGAASIPPRTNDEPIWVEMEIHVDDPPPVVEPEPEVAPEPEPLPQPEPEPQPEPQPTPVQEPETVDYQPEPEQAPQPEPPPPKAKPVPRQVQGLDANSFAEGVNTGLSANHGNTTSTKQTATKLALDDDPGEFAIVPYTSVTKPPKARYKPRLLIPQSIIDAELQGRVEVVLTIDASGKVTSAKVVQGLHPDADKACLDSLRRSRWRPGSKDGTPVITQQVPYSCRFEMAVD